MMKTLTKSGNQKARIVPTPFEYFGNRGENARDLLSKLIGERKFDAFYDPCCGSGSITLAAMQLGLAQKYVMSDSYAPLIFTWKTVRENPEKLIADYKVLLEEFHKRNSADKASFYEEIKSRFANNNDENCAYFCFLINHAENNQPAMKEGVFTSPLNKQLLNNAGGAASQINAFKEKVMTCHQFIKQYDLEIKVQSFEAIKDTVKSGDLVFLDMPYPDLKKTADGAHIYHRLQKKSGFHEEAQRFMAALNANKTAYIACYGAILLHGLLGFNFKENKHIFDSKSLQLQHLLALNGALSDPMPYLENIYLSHAMHLSHLPADMRFYNTLAPLRDRERFTVTGAWNRCFHLLFEDYAAWYPNNICIAAERSNSDENNTDLEKFTYEEINKLANRLAHYLIEQKLGKNALIAIGVDNAIGSEFIASILAVFKAGAAYMPFSLSETPNVISNILFESKADYCLLAKKEHQNKIPAEWQSTYKDRLISIDEIICKTKISTDNPALADPVQPNDLAYVMYTSGSAGKPKGVEITHRGIPYAIKAHQDVLNLSRTDRILQLAKPGFDASLMEILAALGTGATLYIPTQNTRDDNSLLEAFINTNQINVAIFVPSKLSSFGDPTGRFSSLRNIIITGEGFDVSLARAWRNEQRSIINGYGLTETTICATLAIFDGKLLSIGKPIIGTQIYLLSTEKDENGNRKLITGPQHEGEIIVTGASLARGYRHSKPSKEKFSRIKAKTADGNLVEIQGYCTGDLAEYDSKGNLLINGRTDNEFKLRGQRISPEHIETIILDFPDHEIKHCCVAKIVKKSFNNSLAQYLVAYTVLANREEINEREFKFNLINYLKQKLPAYMIPNGIAIKNDVTLNKNGKLDRKAFLKGPNQENEPIPLTISINEQALPITAQEKELARIWKQLIPTVSEDYAIKYDDDIFSLGATSLELSQLPSKLKASQYFKNADSLPFTAFQTFSQLRDMANVSSKGLDLHLIRKGVDTYPPIYCIHSITGLDAQTEYSYFFGDFNFNSVFGLSFPYPVKKKLLKDISINTLARYNINRIMAAGHNPDKPLLLLGWSTGGIIAFEMARQLKKLGYKEVILYLVDAVAPNTLLEIDDNQFNQELANLEKCLLKTDQPRMIFDETKTRKKKVTALFKYLRKNSSDVKKLKIAEYLFKATLDYAKWLGKHIQELSYMPDGCYLYKASETIIRSSSINNEANQLEDLGWQKLCPTIVICEYEGDHFAIQNDPKALNPLKSRLGEKYFDGKICQILRRFYTNPEQTTMRALSERKLTLREHYVNPIIVARPISEEIEVKQQEETKIHPTFENTNIRLPGKKKVKTKNFFTDGARKNHPQRICLSGRSGAGKTTFIKKLIQEYLGEKHPNSPSLLGTGLWSNKFKLILWIPLEKLKEIRDLALKRGNSNQFGLTLKDLLFFLYFQQENDGELLANYLARRICEYPNDYLLLLDTWDAVAQDSKSIHLESLIEQLLRHPFLIITSRNFALSELKQHYSPEDDQRFKQLELLGFNKKRIYKYLKKAFANNKPVEKDIKELISRNAIFAGLAAIPIQLVFLCETWQDFSKDSNAINRTTALTELYRRMVDKSWSRLNLSSNVIQKLLEYLKRLAVICLRNNLVNFSGLFLNELAEKVARENPYGSHNFMDEIKRLPFLHAYRIGQEEFCQEQTYFFMHIALRDFFAGGAIADTLINENKNSGCIVLYDKNKAQHVRIEDFILDILLVNPSGIVLLFTAGLLNDNPAAQERFINIILNFIKDVFLFSDSNKVTKNFKAEKAAKKLLLILRCLEECAPSIVYAKEETLREIMSNFIAWLKANPSADININDGDDEGNTLLHYAIAKNNIDLIEALLECGANPLKPNFLGVTPIYDAYTKSKREVFSLLMSKIETKKHWEVINQRTEFNWTLLIGSVWANQNEATKDLIERQANVNVHSSEGEPGYFFDSGDVEFPSGSAPDVPLALAIINQNKAIVELILKHGARINVRISHNNGAYSGASVLHLAILTHDKLIHKCGVLAELLSDAATKLKGSILEHLIKEIKSKFPFLLNAKGGRFNHTPLHEALHLDCSLSLIKFLVNNGADVSREIRGRLPLHYAKNKEVKDYLLVATVRKYFQQEEEFDFAASYFNDAKSRGDDLDEFKSRFRFYISRNFFDEKQELAATEEKNYYDFIKFINEHQEIILGKVIEKIINTYSILTTEKQKKNMRIRLAASMGLIDSVKRLLPDEDIDLITPDGIEHKSLTFRPVLYEACVSGNIDLMGVVEKAITNKRSKSPKKASNFFIHEKAGPSKNILQKQYTTETKYGWTPLIAAVWKNDANMTRHIIKKLKENDCMHAVNTKNQQGETALHWAAQLGYAEIALILLQEGAEIIADKGGFTPLHRAAHNGDSAMLEVLTTPFISNFKDMINSATKEAGMTALHEAVQTASIRLNMINEKARENDAIDQKKLETLRENVIIPIKILIEAGADPFRKTHKKLMPLDFAQQNTAIEKILKTYMSQSYKDSSHEEKNNNKISMSIR